MVTHLHTTGGGGGVERERDKEKSERVGWRGDLESF